jgi:hypothetical protein
MTLWNIAKVMTNRVGAFAGPFGLGRREFQAMMSGSS